VAPLPATSSDVHSRYGCRAPRGERAYARRNDEVEMPAHMRKSVRARVATWLKVTEALEAEGRVSRVGMVILLSV
jgi:hypothetical protein